MHHAPAPGALAQAPMPYFLRPMRLEDIAQVSLVERECFSTGWVPTPFKRDLHRESMCYLVACQARTPANADREARAFSAVRQPDDPPPVLERLVRGIKGLGGADRSPSPDFSQRIVGFLGLWYIVDEAHVTVVGVREAARRNGIGELLLLGGMEAALRRGMRTLTLEVRASNLSAQALYTKYGFRQAGVRKGYYTDNHEDALIMTTAGIADPAYHPRFLRLRDAHAARWGRSVRYLG